MNDFLEFLKMPRQAALDLVFSDNLEISHLCPKCGASTHGSRLSNMFRSGLCPDCLKFEVSRVYDDLERMLV